MSEAAHTEARRHSVLLTLSWLWVGLPFGYGLVQLVIQSIPLFTG